MNISQFYMYKLLFSRGFAKRISPLNIYGNANKLFNGKRFYADEPKFSPRFSNSGGKNSQPLPHLVHKINSTKNYFIALALVTLGGAYAAVPLYRIFCQASGFGGTTQHDLGGEKIEKMQKKPYRKISVKFMSDVSTKLQWNFKPQQSQIEVIPGETALAFYTATNPLDKPIVGISTYNVLPFEAGPYFNKIQCFCFEEQQLNPNEQVDLPVFFYIDPEFCEDPMMEKVDEIILSYTFFQAKDGMSVKNVFKRT